MLYRENESMKMKIGDIGTAIQKSREETERQNTLLRQVNEETMRSILKHQTDHTRVEIIQEDSAQSHGMEC